MERTQDRPRVLVGVDGSPAALAALRFAAGEARLRRGTLVALTAVERPDYAWIDPYGTLPHPEEATLDRARHRLEELVAAAEVGDLAVELVVTPDSAPAALVARSAAADLLVVGSRGHGGFRGLLMGSVSSQCVLHAQCPVTVVRPQLRPADAEEHRTLDATRRQTTAPFI